MSIARMTACTRFPRLGQLARRRFLQGLFRIYHGVDLGDFGFGSFAFKFGLGDSEWGIQFQVLTLREVSQNYGCFSRDIVLSLSYLLVDMGRISAYSCARLVALLPAFETPAGAQLPGV